MILEYKFKYISNNDYFISILNNIVEKKNISYKINKNNDYIFLYIEADEDKLLKISNQLSQELPMSIFLKDFTLEVVPQMVAKSYQHLVSPRLKKSYCSNCLHNIEDEEADHFYNPFYNCDICGTTCDVTNIKFLNDNKELNFKNYKQLFESLAFFISEGKKVKINTSRGGFVFKKINEKINKETQLLCTNVNNISNLVVSSKLKTASLLSIEKPIVTFNINAMIKSSNNLEIEKIDLVYAYDLILHLLSKELEQYNINFLTYEQSDEFDSEFTYETKQPSQIFPKLKINENKFFLLQNSDYEQRLTDLYKKFDEKSKGQFMVLLDENKLYEKSILNIYTSTKYDDNISLYSPKIDGMLDILNFELPNTISDIFNEIEKEDKGERLLSNYKEKFPTIFLNAQGFQIFEHFQTNSIFSLLKIASIILGIDDIYDNANKALLQKGPRIDYKLIDSEKIFNREFDMIKFIKSGISFKLAGVDDKTLSLGYLESYIYFISDLIDKVNEEFPLDGISFCGDFVAEDIFNKTINEIFSNNLKIYNNKDFPIQL